AARGDVHDSHAVLAPIAHVGCGPVRGQRHAVRLAMRRHPALKGHELSLVAWPNRHACQAASGEVDDAETIARVWATSRVRPSVDRASPIGKPGTGMLAPSWRCRPSKL